jgi:hypothetical protein
MVVVIDSCPRRCWMFGRGTPAAMSQATWVCRRSWGVNRLAKPPRLGSFEGGEPSLVRDAQRSGGRRPRGESAHALSRSASPPLRTFAGHPSLGPAVARLLHQRLEALGGQKGVAAYGELLRRPLTVLTPYDARRYAAVAPVAAASSGDRVENDEDVVVVTDYTC